MAYTDAVESIGSRHEVFEILLQQVLGRQWDVERIEEAMVRLVAAPCRSAEL
jgi:hypothetical protein